MSNPGPAPRPAPQWRIPLSRPQVEEDSIQAVVEVLRGPSLSLGPRLESFEGGFAAAIGSRHAVGVSSGTCGLHLAVRALGWGLGDEVITTPFSFIASSNCLLFENASPVFVDIHLDTFLMDLDQAEAAITSYTRGLLPVHVFGNIVDMERALQMARRRGLRIIEDACEAVGGMWGGRCAGSWGDLGVFGFYPNKQMTTGEGGMVVTDDDRLAERVRCMRNQGRSPAGDGSFCDLGYNYRLTEVAAAMGETQLRRLPEFLEARREKQRIYRDLLQGIDEVRVPPFAADRSPFVFIVQTSEPGLRDRLQEALTGAGIQSAIYFRAIHLEPFYRDRFGFAAGMFPRTEHAAGTCLAIPFHNRIPEADQQEVAQTIRRTAARWLAASRLALSR